MNNFKKRVPRNIKVEKEQKEEEVEEEIRSPLRRLKSIARVSNTFNYSFQEGYLSVKPTNLSRLHTRCITVIKISSGLDPFVVSAGLDCLLFFSKYNTGEVLKEINTGNSFVFDISILKSMDEILVATASQDGNVRIYDVNRNYSCISLLKQSSVGVCQIVWAVQLFVDTTTTGTTGTSEITGITMSPTTTTTTTTTTTATTTARQPQRNFYCISAGATKVIHVVDLKTREEIFCLPGHREGIRCLAISEDE